MGNLTSSAPSGPGSSTLRPTTYTYDAPGHLLSITADGTKTAVLLDALGRRSLQTFATACGGTWCWDPTRNVAYEYLDTGSSVIGLDQVNVDVVTYSYIDAIGNRLSSITGGATGWILPDLHGNVVAVVAGGSSPTFLSAYRFDAYGETCAAWHPASGAMDVPWRYQGRMLQSAPGSTDLYDFGARSYDPSLGAFTSFDSVAGSAMNPLTLNRYLYALANPATMVDPDGHKVDPCASSGGYAAGCGVPAPAKAPARKRGACTVDTSNLDRCGGHLYADLEETAHGLNVARAHEYACWESGNYAAGCTGPTGNTGEAMRGAAKVHAESEARKAAEEARRRAEEEARKRNDCGFPPNLGCVAGNVGRAVVSVGGAVVQNTVAFVSDPALASHGRAVLHWTRVTRVEGTMRHRPWRT